MDNRKKDDEYIYRGGSYYNAGNIAPAGMREVGNEYKAANTIGFRAIMYKTGESTIEGYNEPYIPDGFTHTEGEWNNGFVIKEDETGNEFVWIPVDGYNLNLDRSEFEKTFTTMRKSADTTEIRFKLSIYSYGGYYVSRYEAGVGDTSGNNIGIPVSKKDATVWTNISQENAKASAEKMYESNNQINSRLMSSYTYDTMLNWLKKTDYSANTYNVDTDSTSWGNYRNNESTSNSKTLSGSNEQWKANNIYDLAGNVWEWTTEIYNKEAVARGGDYLSNGDVLPAGARDNAVKNSAFDHTGYRILMYKIAQYGAEDNAPKLSDGMTPVKWNGTEWVPTTPDDEEWYDYSNKKWANVMLQDGSMFVWIPRYAYNIQSNWHTSGVEDIQIKFLRGKTNIPRTGESITISKESGEGNWLVHPAFTYGDTQIEGIWVAKYLASLSDATSSSQGSSTDIAIKENVKSYTTASVSEAYELSIQLNDEGNKGGLNTDDNITDPHLLKNIEWGAVIYLTHSEYGRNSAISTKNTSKKTGIDKEDSTTGNETGIFDMDKIYSNWRGTATTTRADYYYEYYNEIVVAYVNNGNSRLTTYGEKLINAPDRHKDVYDIGTDDTYNDNYLANSDKYGDAIYETSNSCIRPQFYPNKNYPFFYRSEVKNYMFAATDGNSSVNGNTANYSQYNFLSKRTNYYHYVFYNMFRPSIVVY